MQDDNRAFTTPLARAWKSQFPATRIGLTVLTVVSAVAAILALIGRV